MKSIITVALLVTFTGVEAASARLLSEKERMRQQAEHLCYGDVQKLCDAEASNEGLIEACLKSHRTELSPGCRKVFDGGLK